MSKPKTQKVYRFIRQELVYVQVNEISYKSKADLEQQLSLMDESFDEEPLDIFEYRVPENIKTDLNFELSVHYTDDVNDEESLHKNLSDFISPKTETTGE